MMKKKGFEAGNLAAILFVLIVVVLVITASLDQIKSSVKSLLGLGSEFEIPINQINKNAKEGFGGIFFRDLKACREIEDSDCGCLIDTGPFSEEHELNINEEGIKLNFVRERTNLNMLDSTTFSEDKAKIFQGYDCLIDDQEVQTKKNIKIRFNKNGAYLYEGEKGESFLDLLPSKDQTINPDELLKEFQIYKVDGANLCWITENYNYDSLSYRHCGEKLPKFEIENCRKRILEDNLFICEGIQSGDILKILGTDIAFNVKSEEGSIRFEVFYRSNGKQISCSDKEYLDLKPNSDKFFSCKNYPRIRFNSNGVDEKGINFEVQFLL